MRSDQVCRFLDEFAHGTGRRAEREVDASVHASVTEMPVGKRVELVAGEQGLELAQVPCQPVWRDRRVLPPRPRGVTVRCPTTQSGAVLPDSPQRGGSLTGNDSGVLRPGARNQPSPGRDRLCHRRSARLGKQPTATARQGRHGSNTPTPADDLHQAGVETFESQRSVWQKRRDRLRCRRHVRVAEDDERDSCRRRREPHRGSGDHTEGALGPDEKPGYVEAVLGKQVLERVARNLAAEPPELGTDHSEPVTHDVVERADHRHLGLVPGREAVPAIAAGGEADAGRGQDVEVHDVVSGTAVAQGPGATDIVAEAAADGGSGLGRRLWPESQPVLGPCPRDGVEDRARLHAGRAGIRIDSKNPVEMAGKVDHDAGADRVAGYRRSGAATRNSNTETAADRDDRLDLVSMARKDDRAGDDPVVGGVGGVFRPTAGGYVDVASACPRQLRRELRGRDGYHPVIVSNHPVAVVRRVASSHPTPITASRARVKAPWTGMLWSARDGDWPISR